MGFFAMSGYPDQRQLAPGSVLVAFQRQAGAEIVAAAAGGARHCVGDRTAGLGAGPFGVFLGSGYLGYIVHNAGLYTLQHPPPGVFGNNPWTWSANGAIWMLPMEFTGYLLVLGFGVAGLFRRAPCLTITLMLTLIGLDRRFEASIGNPGHGGSFLQVPIGAMVAFLVAFSIGMVLHAYRDKIPLSPGVAWSLVGLQIAVQTTKAGAVTLPFMAGCGALVLAFHWPARLEG
jgi:hypothetical protein